MSLQLRNKTQETLNNHGLAKLHCRVDKHKTLTLNEKCGKTILPINGIVFDNRTPKVKEYSLAIKLLDAFLTEHSKLIAEMLEIDEKLSKELEYEMPEGYVYEYNFYQEVHYISVKGINYSIETKKIKVNNYTRLSDVTKLLESKEFKTNIKNIVAHKNKTEMLSIKLNELKSKLDKCDI